MIQNHFKVALRSLVKQKTYTLISIIGLAASITACLFIVLYVSHELSFDKFNPKADRIYKMVLERKYPNHSTFYSRVPSSFASVALKDFPEIKNTLRFTGPWDEATFTYKRSDDDIRSIYNSLLIQADSSFFSFFNLKFLRGDKKTALSRPNQIVITEQFAKKLFKNEDPLNKVINGGNFGEFKITGVCQSLPENSHLKFDLIGSLLTDPYYYVKDNNYTSFYTHTYFELNPGADPKLLESKFPKMVDTYASGEIERELKMSWSEYKREGNGYRYFLQPLASIHLDPRNFELTFMPSGNLKYIYVLIFIALLIITVACINYINLATARSAERAREVGVRKVMGSSKIQLVLQFLSESVFLSFVATSIAVILVYLLLPNFNSLINKNLVIFFSPYLFFGLISIIIIIGIIAGLYPAFVLSSHKPAIVMKGSFARNEKGLWLRNGLVSFQFAISTILIACTIIVMQQMHFVQSKEMGFDKDNIVMIDWAYALESNLNPFLIYLRGLDAVQSVGGVGGALGEREWDSMRLQPEGSNEVLTVKYMLMDDNFSGTIGFTFKDGRTFSKEFNDSLSLILNESAVRTLGLKNPIGQKLKNTSTKDDGTTEVKEYTIVGIVNDFNFQPLHDEITPFAIISSELYGGFFPTIATRLKGKDLQATVQKIETKWNELAPGKLFRYSFLDQRMNKQYAEEQRSSKLFAIFSTLAQIIGCVGLFGLSAYTASSRSKELSIRKVLGASVANLTVLLSKNFGKLIIVAIAFAIPFSWWLMWKWLQGFAYRIEMGWGAFLFAGVVALIIPLAIVGYQSIKTSLVNPIKYLRSE